MATKLAQSCEKCGSEQLKERWALCNFVVYCADCGHVIFAGGMWPYGKPTKLKLNA